MLLLFDTSTTTSVVTLASDDGEPLIGNREYPRSEGGSSKLLTGAVEMLGESGGDISLVSGLVISRGPGSYTGLRVGYSLAQGLAESLDVPVVTVPSWCAFAAQYRSPSMALCVCYDARSRGIAWVTCLPEEDQPLRREEGSSKSASHVLAEDVMELGEEGVQLQIAPAGAIPGFVPRPCRLAGPGIGSFQAGFDHDPPDDMEIITGSDRAAPEHLLKLGATALLNGGEDLLQILPFYLGTMEPAVTRSGG